MRQGGKKRGREGGGKEGRKEEFQYTVYPISRDVSAFSLKVELGQGVDSDCPWIRFLQAMARML